MSYDDNISSNIGENYDRIHSVYSDILKSSENTNILKKPRQKSRIDELLTYLLNWKLVLAFFLTIIILFIISGNEILKLIKKNNLYDVYGTNMISFFIYSITINMFIALFTISFYFNKKKILGGKGPRGDIGEKGLQGKNDLCDICTNKPQRIKRSKQIEETLEVDEPVKMEILNKEIKGWNKTTNALSIGDSKFCKKCKKHNYVYEPDIKYLTGVIANFNQKEQIIENIQFLYKNTKNETKLHGSTKGIWGDNRKIQDIQELVCPTNSAIFKIEAMYITSNTERNASINGLKINCKDIRNGKEMVIESNSLGVNYDENSNIYKSASIECPDISQNDELIPGYLADMSATFEDKINEIIFKKCNYYYK